MLSSVSNILKPVPLQEILVPFNVIVINPKTRHYSTSQITRRIVHGMSSVGEQVPG